MSNAEPAVNASVRSRVFLCPKCGKQLEVAMLKESVQTCPFCRAELGAGADRRREARIGKEIPAVLEYRGGCLGARSKDLSKGGLCVRTSGEFPGTPGDSLGLFVGPHHFLADVMWVDNLFDVSTVGLQWRSRMMNLAKKMFFSAASVGGLFYLIFMSCLLLVFLYLSFFK